ncbi:unnamed protein product [Paramecium primaurelia]|uniref:Uncharacterized protein n=1 Tax=Paramecium primaurelia TaxID=5886 RepID=A0A8S1NW71_PARPR|nr:unnamed protein product [Paramecium primaurelia]
METMKASTQLPLICCQCQKEYKKQYYKQLAFWKYPLINLIEFLVQYQYTCIQKKIIYFNVVMIYYLQARQLDLTQKEELELKFMNNSEQIINRQEHRLRMR